MPFDETSMSDRIIISGLRARCIIGTNEEERRDKQEVSISIALSADLRKAGRSDRLEDSVDYRAVKKKILGMVENSHDQLLEALAEAIAQVCLETPGVSSAHVRVDKPFALRFARSVAVEIARNRIDDA